jgi:Xaa-Pro aminopeptidase
LGPAAGGRIAPLSSRYRIFAAVPDVLIYADTVRSPELRHEIPLSVPDPFLYVERNGTRHVVTHSLELPRLRSLAGLEVHALEDFGADELRRSGLDQYEVRDEIIGRACAEFGISQAVVPADFPLDVADALRANGIDISVDRELFEWRRRVKGGAELEGMRRAQRAAEAGMEAARVMLRAALAGSSTITVEEIKAAILQRFLDLGASADELIVSHGPQSAIGHDAGSGEILRDEPVVIDLFPHDNASGVYADMTRTFVFGEPSDELRHWYGLCKRALDRALGEIRAGVTGRSVFDGTCEIFEAAGFATPRKKEDGVPLEEGFIHSLGHGVGLEVHEAPSLGLLGTDPLVAGDAVSVEPGLYRPGYGGLRLEDLVLVTDDGCENLTDFPYDLELA